MATVKKVQLILSTYNGEKYLAAQLDSILAQTIADDICVLVRDDGSTDGTREILESYAKYENFRIEYGENIGITDSYMWLLENCDQECLFYAFSDQDDVWLPEKVETAVQSLEQRDNSRPVLFASRSHVVDQDLNHLGYSVPPEKGISFYNAIVQNVCPGHTHVINGKMREMIMRSHGTEGVLVMDWWITLIASGVGEIVYSEDALVLHRQHGSNAVGYRTSFIKLLISRLRRLHDEEAAAITKQLQSFLSFYKSDLPEIYRKEAEGFIDGLTTLKGRVCYLRHSRIYRQTAMGTFSVKFLYLLGKYKLRK